MSKFKDYINSENVYVCYFNKISTGRSHCYGPYNSYREADHVNEQIKTLENISKNPEKFVPQLVPFPKYIPFFLSNFIVCFKHRPTITTHFKISETKTQF